MSRRQAKCFQILGLTGDEDLPEIRRAYRKIARRLHPDRQGGDGAQFSEITAAYNELVGELMGGHRASRKARTEHRRSRSHRRANTQSSRSDWTAWRPDEDSGRERANSWEEADWSSFERVRRQRRARAERGRAQTKGCEAGARTRHTSDAGRRRDPGAGATRQKEEAQSERLGGSSTSHSRQNTQDEDFKTAFRRWCDEGLADDKPSTQSEEPASDSATQTANRKSSLWARLVKKIFSGSGPEPGRLNVSLGLPIGPEIVMKGGRMRIAINRMVLCPSCDGACAPSCVCLGAGRVKIRQELEIDVPQGAQADQELVVPGMGTVGLNGEADGDLILILKPADIPGFRRHGLDLHGTVIISRQLAQKGGRIDVDLPNGTVKLRVPPRTCVGDRFRLRGQGMPAVDAATRGDAYLMVEVQ